MPNALVPAAAGGMPKFNRSQIMKAAWEHYRSAKAYVATNPYLRGAVVRFGDCLKEEWKRAKAAAAKKPVSAAVAARIAALKAEILVLDCRSFRYSIADPFATASAPSVTRCRPSWRSWKGRQPNGFVKLHV